MNSCAFACLAASIIESIDTFFPMIPYEISMLGQHKAPMMVFKAIFSAIVLANKVGS